jgi:hypothetical protein
MTYPRLFTILLSVVCLPRLGFAQFGFFSGRSILESLQSITAVPPSGDLNPYGVAFVPAEFPGGGSIASGDVLVSNFNNSDNTQGTGTTIVSISPTGQQSVFATSVLYVASTNDNTIFAISQAGSRTTSAGQGAVIFTDAQHLHGPLGLALEPNGNLITANGDAVNATGTPNELVEFTPDGRLIATYQLDGGAPGGAFGVALIASEGTVRFAAVDDDLNTVTIWTLHPGR